MSMLILLMVFRFYFINASKNRELTFKLGVLQPESRDAIQQEIEMIKGIDDALIIMTLMELDLL